jgi:antitoxin (DNA-binding transcriptional repressor) of toxin-antitoxin stability system
MTTRSATVRDLRTRFPRVRRLVEQEGEVVVTDRGRPIIILRAYERPAEEHPVPIDYYARLRARMPKALSSKTRRDLDEADRGER